MDKIEAFENELKSLGCLLIEPEKYDVEDAIILAKNDTSGFLEIIKTFTGKTIVFSTIAESMYYMVIFHGQRIELEVPFESDVDEGTPK